MTVLVEFDVIGVPAPQGSKKAFVANGRAMMKEASGGHAAWRNAVAEKAREAADGVAWGGPLDGPLGISIEFRFPMPKSRTKAQRALGRILKTTAPDSSKLLRCVEDGITAGGLVIDDARFCVHRDITKVEVVGWTGAHITITREDNVAITTRRAA